MQRKSPEQRTADRFLAGTILVGTLGIWIALTMSAMPPRYNFIILVVGVALSVVILLRGPDKKSKKQHQAGNRPPAA